jgi:hypothetical protein
MQFIEYTQNARMGIGEAKQSRVFENQQEPAGLAVFLWRKHALRASKAQCYNIGSDPAFADRCMLTNLEESR